MNQCPYDPKPLVNVPLGMFHCPICREMVIAGLEHPDYDEEITEIIIKGGDNSEEVLNIPEVSNT